ncbi:MAG: rbsC 2 [Thermoanaerobacter sp.]|jgi:ribose transport system permease protein|nr:rbsC 2 [Thermoanaerobacter sp.]
MLQEVIKLSVNQLEIRENKKFSINNAVVIINNYLSRIGIKPGTILGLFVLIVLLSLSTEKFLTVSNIMNVVRQVSINAIIAFGMTYVILTGGIDLSLGSTIALAGVAAAFLLGWGFPNIVVIILTLLFGAVFGVLNGIGISKGKLPPFVVTLATMTIYRGVAFVLTQGRPIKIASDSTFVQMGVGYFLNIPIPVIILFVMLIVTHVLLDQTKFGKYVYIIGGNKETARLSGINIDKTIIWIYTISGICAALSGIIMAARLYSGQPNAGQGYELDAVAAAILGGTSITGGIGTILGTFIGALIIGILNNGMNLLNIDFYYQLVVKGVVIILAVLLDTNRK